MDDKYRRAIENEFKNCVTNTMERLSSNGMTYRPFHSALLSNDVIFWSAFERSFSTSFGQRVIEEIARLVVLSNGAEDASRQKETIISIDVAYDNAIHNHLDALRQNMLYDISWNTAYSQVKNIPPTGTKKDVRIISDLWWKKDGVNNYVSLKTVKPNIDQTVVAKEDCLRLKIADPNCNVYFGLPYNPYGENRANYAHNPPMGIFDFHNDPIVLIGRDLWDTLGGHNCYNELLNIATKVGAETRDMIAKWQS